MELRFGRTLCGLLLAVPFSVCALSQRTFVATNGVDNPACSIAAPCRGFAAAVLVTAANGEVLVLNSGGYGPVTITQSLSIVTPPGVYAGVSVASGDGIAINAAATDVVTLRGLTINSIGGTNGIHVISAGKVALERLTITNFVAGGIGAGILCDAAGAVQLTVDDTSIRRADTGISVPGHGILALREVAISDVNAAIVTQGQVHVSGQRVSVARATAAALQFLLTGGGNTSVSFDRLDVWNAVGGGILVQTGAASGLGLDVKDSSFVLVGKVIFVDASTGGANQVTLTRSRIGYSINRAVDVTGGAARVGISDVTIENSIADRQISIDVTNGSISTLQMSNTRMVDFGGTAVYTHAGSAPGMTALLSRNVISGGSKGVVADANSTVRLSGNSFANLGSTALTVQGTGSAMTSLGDNFVDGDVGIDAVPTKIPGI